MKKISKIKENNGWTMNDLKVLKLTDNKWSTVAHL